MKKYINVIIIVAVLIVVFVGVFLISKLTAPKYLKEITFAEYSDIVKKDKNSYFYYGESKEDKEILKEMAKTYNWVIYYFNLEKLNDKEKEIISNGNYDGINGIFKVMKKDILLFEYTGKFDDNDFKDSLVASEIIPKGIQEVNLNKYLEIIDQKGYQVMFIGAAHCGYCTMFKPEVESVIAKYGIDVYYIDLDALTEEEGNIFYSTDEYFTTYGVSTPLTFIYKDGKRIDALSGYVGESEIINFLKRNGVI